MIREIKSVYVFGGDRGPRKIGISANPAARCAKLATGHAGALRVLHAVPVPAHMAANIEALTHEALAAFHQHGEWFRVSLARAKQAIGEAIDRSAKGETAKRKSVGRRKQWSEDMQARFKAGTFDRIARTLTDGEDRTDFVRAAVEAELKRREKP